MSVAHKKLVIQKMWSTKYLIYKSVYSGSRFYMCNHLSIYRWTTMSRACKIEYISVKEEKRKRKVKESRKNAKPKIEGIPKNKSRKIIDILKTVKELRS